VLNSKLFRLTASKATKVYFTGSGCCTDEWIQCVGSSYDIGRLGFSISETPEESDLLVIYGAVTRAELPHLVALYNRICRPKMVLALGACACSGGIFHSAKNKTVIAGIDQEIPVDVFVPGCPPRPEAIIEGLLKVRLLLTEPRMHGSRIDQ